MNSSGGKSDQNAMLRSFPLPLLPLEYTAFPIAVGVWAGVEVQKMVVQPFSVIMASAGVEYQLMPTLFYC